MRAAVHATKLTIATMDPMGLGSLRFCRRTQSQMLNVVVGSEPRTQEECMSERRTLVLGGDGYCGWATALHLSARGHVVGIVDNFARRDWDAQLGVRPLTRLASLPQRLACWEARTGTRIPLYIGDIGDGPFLASAVRDEEFHQRCASTRTETELIQPGGSAMCALEMRRLSLAGRARVMTSDLERAQCSAATECPPAHRPV